MNVKSLIRLNLIMLIILVSILNLSKKKKKLEVEDIRRAYPGLGEL